MSNWAAGWVTFSRVCPNCGQIFNDATESDLSEGLTNMWRHKDCENPTGADDDRRP